MEMGSGSLGPSEGSGDNEPPHGLKFGKRIYVGDLGGGDGAGGSSSGAPVSCPAASLAAQAPPAGSPPAAPKRGKRVVQGGKHQPSRCLVEGCGADLTGVKTYYRRHKVCGMHSKSPKVVVAGLEQRFCQQCSRFHQLHEFDQGKRSCRRRLADHNERRRKPTPGTLRSRYGLPPPSFHDGGGIGSFLMDFSYPTLPATSGDTWPVVGIDDGGAPGRWQRRAAVGTAPSGGVMPSGTPLAHVQGSAAGGPLFSSQEAPPPGEEGMGVSDSGCALSLLSTRPRGGATATAVVRAPTDSGNYLGGATAGSPPDGFASSVAWGLEGVEPGGGSGTHEIGGPGDGQFSGDHHPAHGGVSCSPGNLVHRPI